MSITPRCLVRYGRIGLSALLALPVPAAAGTGSRARAAPARASHPRIHAPRLPRPARPVAAQRTARPPAKAGSAEKAALEIPGLRTAEDAALVVGTLRRLRGVNSAIVDPNTRLAVVDYDPGLIRLPGFLAACCEAGFEAAEYRVESRFPKPIKLKGG